MVKRRFPESEKESLIPSQETATIRWILRAEAVAAFAGGTILWFANGGTLLWFIPALLLPDVSMLGYVVNSRSGATVYNAVHNLTLAAVALGLGWWLDYQYVLLLGAALLAHVGMDRGLGYGLKLPSGFQDTHLGRIGRDA